MKSESIIINNPNSVFLKIWTSPRTAFKSLKENQHEKYVPWLLLLSALGHAFEKLGKGNDFENIFFWEIGLLVLPGAIFYSIAYYIYAKVLSWMGKQEDGKADTKVILRMMSYSMIPSIISSLLTILLISIYGTRILYSPTETISGWLLYTYDGLKALLGIWTLILLVIGISEVQQFSIGKSILQLVLPVISFASIILLTVLIFELIQ